MNDMSGLQCVLVMLLMTCALAMAQLGYVAGVFDDPAMANATLTYSEIAYCGDYATREYSGAAAGFVYTYEFNGLHENQGLMGYNPNDQTIYISFRGSSDPQNWITNLEAFQKDCPASWNIAGCGVHKGFFNAEQDVIPGIYANLKSLMDKYPSYKVVVTGHSLGAALATVTAADLISSYGVPASKVTLWNYGSPRVFNEAGSVGVSSMILSIHRVTHHKDLVPHSPTHNMNYQHIDNEWYEDPTADVVSCTGYEDPNCSYKWAITSIKDHLVYMGLDIGEAGCGWV